MKCAFCNVNLYKYPYAHYYVLLNDNIKMICSYCFNTKYKNITKCSVCNKIINYPYFLKNNNNISLVCKECYNKVY